jgi:hypothetical protein
MHVEQFAVTQWLLLPYRAYQRADFALPALSTFGVPHTMVLH